MNAWIECERAKGRDGIGIGVNYSACASSAFFGRFRCSKGCARPPLRGIAERADIPVCAIQLALEN
jgi:hypothetical protein